MLESIPSTASYTIAYVTLFKKVCHMANKYQWMIFFHCKIEKWWCDNYQRFKRDYSIRLLNSKQCTVKIVSVVMYTCSKFVRVWNILLLIEIRVFCCRKKILLMHMLANWYLKAWAARELLLYLLLWTTSILS